MSLASLPNFPKRSILSGQERNVVSGLVHGMTNKEIARELGISPRTVEDYRFHALQKLCLRKVVQLPRLVYQIN